MKDLSCQYRKKKKKIKERLQDFKAVYKKGEEEVFAELSFCLFTPQSRAETCDRAVKDLEARGLLLKGARNKVRKSLKGVRFPNNKTAFFLAARRLFKKNGSFRVKEIIDTCNIQKTREWFVKNVKGLGYKEASHFLRNIGFGKDLAILDVHILKNLKRFGVIKEIPPTITKKRYLAIESRMKAFSRDIGIPLDALDLLLWSRETGIIFK